MKTRYIITSVIILVVAMVIFSYIFQPEIRSQINSFFSNIGAGVSSSVRTPSSNNLCLSQAKAKMKMLEVQSSIKAHMDIVDTKSFNNSQDAKDYIKSYLQWYSDSPSNVYGNLNNNGEITITISKFVSDDYGSYYPQPLYAFVCVNNSI